MLTQVANQIAIAVENALAFREIAELKDKLNEEKLYLEGEIQSEYNFEEIVGDSAALKQVLKQVEIVAPTDSTVLILGETGTGKERLARATHNHSGRRGRTFVKMNCAAIRASGRPGTWTGCSGRLGRPCSGFGNAGALHATRKVWKQ